MLALALAALGLGSLLVAPFLQAVSVNAIASRNYDGIAREHYAADAGVEDGIWRLTEGLLSKYLSAPGDSYSYSIAETVNGLSPMITITRDKVIIAEDGFESASWSGGSGWSKDWYHEGDASIVTSGSPHGGSRHLQLLRNTGYVRRITGLSGQAGAHLQFWAKARSFEGGEEARCLISPNGSDWTTVRTWVNGEDDNVYRFNDIDLAAYGLSSTLWIAFEADMSGTGDYLYIDDLAVVIVLSGSGSDMPSDDFESRSWSGGSGWLGSWTHTGDASVRKQGGPHSGSYHLRMRRSNSRVARAADLSGLSGLRLQFWAKVYSFERSDYVQCRVSPDGSHWSEVRTWTSADSDNTYHAVDIDLSPYSMSKEFWIEFVSGMDRSNDYFYIDAIAITGSTAYEVVSVAGRQCIRADIAVAGDEITVNSWQIERE